MPLACPLPCHLDGPTTVEGSPRCLPTRRPRRCSTTRWAGPVTWILSCSASRPSRATRHARRCCCVAAASPPQQALCLFGRQGRGRADAPTSPGLPFSARPLHTPALCVAGPAAGGGHAVRYAIQDRRRPARALASTPATCWCRACVAPLRRLYDRPPAAPAHGTARLLSSPDLRPLALCCRRPR